MLKHLISLIEHEKLTCWKIQFLHFPQDILLSDKTYGDNTRTSKKQNLLLWEENK